MATLCCYRAHEQVYPEGYIQSFITTLCLDKEGVDAHQQFLLAFFACTTSCFCDNTCPSLCCVCRGDGQYPRTFVLLFLVHYKPLCS